VGEKRQVVTKVAVELDGPVVAKVKGTSVANWGWWKNVPEWWM